jgi:hypothetical protein
MSGAAIGRDGYEHVVARRLSRWTRDYLRKAALADLGCVVLGIVDECRGATHRISGSARPEPFIVSASLDGCSNDSTPQARS